jgi:hypothetical protein
MGLIGRFETLDRSCLYKPSTLLNVNYQGDLKNDK